MSTVSARMKEFLRPFLWKRSRWIMQRRTRQFLDTIPDARATNGSGLVVVGPWGDSFVPWYAVSIGLMLAKNGATIRFVVDDVWQSSGIVPHRVKMRAIRQIMAIVATRFDVVYLSEIAAKRLADDELRDVERLARLNATWSLRGEMKQEGRAAEVEEFRENGRHAAGHISAFFENLPPADFLYVPGGIFGDSGLWLREARAKNLRVATFDGGSYRTTLIASDGIACQLEDIPRAYRSLKEKSLDDRDRASALLRAQEEMQRRREGKDAFESQVSNTTKVGEQYQGGVLLALNSSWDAAALGLHQVYPDNTTWIVETARYLLENTDRPVIVRQHPAERLAIAATTEDYVRLLHEAFGDHPRLHFIAADDPINSYDLLERVAAVVVHTSTIGMEAVAFGRPVITGSGAQYADLGFVESARTVPDYERLLGRAARGELEVTAQQREDAQLCFYLTQCCNWIFSAFNPTDFNDWSREPLSHWHAEPAIQRMLVSIATGEPVALLNHRAEHSAPAGR